MSIGRLEFGRSDPAIQDLLGENARLKACLLELADCVETVAKAGMTKFAARKVVEARRLAGDE